MAFLLLILSLSACSGTKKASSPFEPQATDRISLQRTGCYGTCPIYEVVIFGNGIVTYEGKYYTDKTGKFVGQLDGKTTFTLFNKAAGLTWDEYPDEFPIDNVDFPQFFIGLETEKIERKIKGNSRAAIELVELSQEIDQLTENLNWKEQ
jgi:hypothetical protein